jgi:hypothetical protein
LYVSVVDRGVVSPGVDPGATPGGEVLAVVVGVAPPGRADVPGFGTDGDDGTAVRGSGFVETVASCGALDGV